MAKALVLAAPHSGSGKTLVTLALLRALRKAGVRVASAKAGPDYIDPQFHAAATGKPCLNLDPWAMGPAFCASLLNQQAVGNDLVLIEGVMGLFDGPEGAKGSTADLAVGLQLPVMLVVDCAHQAQSIAALVRGFAEFRSDVRLAGVFLNRVKSDRHLALLRESLAPTGLPVLGVLRHNDSLKMPSRHLGLVQAHENQALETFLESAAAGVARETVLDNIFKNAANLTNQGGATALALPPLAQHMTIARDEAFSFCYPHMLHHWRQAGAEISFFSPLANEAPSPQAGAVFLPGGYPELYAGKLAANAAFMRGLNQFQGLIYGECGGYMTLGKGLVDAEGNRHAMAGLLPLETSFAQRKLHLGYRQLANRHLPFPPALRGHEFHYATVISEAGHEHLFEAENAAGTALPAMGLREGRIMGSFAHVIGVAP